MVTVLSVESDFYAVLWLHDHALSCSCLAEDTRASLVTHCEAPSHYAGSLPCAYVFCETLDSFNLLRVEGE